MDNNKTETPEDEREISLNETSLKRPLDVTDVVGGHGPWQFRQWIVFFATSTCNALVLFSVLFLPKQTFCKFEHSDAHPVKLSSYEINSTSTSSELRSQVTQNESTYIENSCNSTECNINSIVSTEKASYEAECWTSETEMLARCCYVIASMASVLLIYFLSNRFGRRSLALLNCIFLVASSMASCWAGSAVVFLILRFITSMAIVTIYLISTISLLEYVHKDFKLLYFFTGHLGWGLAHFLLPAVAWLAKDWTSFNIPLSVICMVLSIFVWLCPESPSSFPISGEPTRCRKALKYAAFVNGYSTTDVDLLSHNLRQRQENKHDLGRLVLRKTKLFCIIYTSFLIFISFTSAFLYFATKWHSEWFKVTGRQISFSFLGTTEIAAALIMFFLTSIIPIKYLWACLSVMSSSLLLIIFSRKKEGSSTSSALLYTVTAFFASAAWALLMAKCFCQKISSTITKFNLIAIAVAVFAGALFASAVILKGDNEDLLLVLAIPHFIFGIAIAFLPDYHFGVVS